MRVDKARLGLGLVSFVTEFFSLFVNSTTHYRIKDIFLHTCIPHPNSTSSESLSDNAYLL